MQPCLTARASDLPMADMLHHDLQTLRLFVALCELRNLSRAAARFNLALSAASRRIKLFEAEAGTPLIKRLPHGLEPTPAGITALRYAEQVLRLSDQFEAASRDHRLGMRGRVRVSASSSALVQRLAADLAAFARQAPDISIELEERPSQETLEALSKNMADLGVVVRSAPQSQYVTIPYAEDRLVVAVPKGHWLAHAERVWFRDLLEDDFVALEGGTAIDRLLAEQARLLGRPFRRKVQVRTFETVCQMVAQGLGTGILPEAALRPFAEVLGLKILHLEDPWAVRHLDLCWYAGHEPEAPTQKLIDALIRR